MDCRLFRDCQISRSLAILLLAIMAATSGCKSKPHDTALDQATDYFDGIQSIRELKPSQSEIAQLSAAKQAGLTDADCVVLMDFARHRQQPFGDGDAIAGLLRAGVSQSSVMALARLNQLGPFAGEAQVMRLAGLSDDVILALAHRRSAGAPALSSAKAAELRNVQLTNAQIMEAVNRGTTDAEADTIITRRQQAGAHSFVPQRGRRR
jgi:hypothetical protein